MTQRSTTQRDRDRAAIRRSGAPCYLCGEPIDYSLRWPDPWCFTVDHVVPIDAGGPDHISNKAAAHWCHNRAKGKRVDGGPTIRRSGSISRPPGRG